MNKGTSNWTKWASGLALLAIALTAGMLGMVLNVSHGLEAGLAAGIAFGLADGAKVLIPIVAGMTGWTRQMKATAAVCVAVSLWSAVNVYMDGAGQALLAKQHGVETVAEQAKAVAELETEAARLSELAASEAARGGCGPNCRDLNRQASDARQRLTVARQARANAKPVEVSGLATIIAMATGESSTGIARGIGAIKAGLFLMLIEALVWLSVPAMTLLATAGRREPETAASQPEPSAKVAKRSATVAKIIADAGAMPAKRGGRAYYLGRLERDHPAIAARVHSGELSVYRASIVAGIRKEPAKRSQWTKADAYMVPEKV